MWSHTEANVAMQELTDVKFMTGEQHNKDMAASRQERDCADTEKITAYLEVRNPFEADDLSLRNIATGVTADDDVNVCEIKEVGQGILSTMTGKSVDEHVFKKKDQVITMNASTSRVIIEQEHINIDPQLLFQRMLTVAPTTEDNMLCMKKTRSSPTMSDLSWMEERCSRECHGLNDSCICYYAICMYVCM